MPFFLSFQLLQSAVMKLRNDASHVNLSTNMVNFQPSQIRFEPVADQSYSTSNQLIESDHDNLSLIFKVEIMEDTEKTPGPKLPHPNFSTKEYDPYLFPV